MKKKEAEKHQEALKLKAEQEIVQKEAEKGLNEAARLSEIPEFESPSIQEKPFGTGKDFGEASIENEVIEGKRKVKPSIYLKSPFNNKICNVVDALTEDERLLAYSFFSMEGEIL